MTFSRPSQIELQQRRAAEREASVRALTATRGRPAVMGGATVMPTQPGRGKPQGKVRQAIRDSARGEPCLVRLPGVCPGDAEMTIWSHAPWGDAGKGRGVKAVDVAGAYCCTACDAVIDRQRPLPPGMTREQVELAWCMGHFRSLVRLAEKGLL